MDVAAEVVDDILTHHGVKGMHWGVRKQYGTVAPTSSNTGVQGLEHFPKAQATSMNNVAKKMDKAYGFKINEYVPLTEAENHRYLAYVMPRNKGTNSIHVTDHPEYKNVLVDLQNKGWFVPSSEKHSVEANITHEAAHGLFHAANVEGKGFVGSLRTPMPIAHIRDSAWKKAEAQGLKDGDIVRATGLKRLVGTSAQYQMAGKLSKYAKSSMFVEEHEAELFSAYHWSPNPPKFVDAFMVEVHTSMGKQVQPFSGRKVAHAA
jgi:hypothetical protein